MADSVVICSGGLDSVTLLHEIVSQGRNPLVLTYHYGQKHDREIQLAEVQAGLLGLKWQLVGLGCLMPIFDVSSLVGPSEIPNIREVMGDPQPSSYVPNRNMIFLSIAVAACEAIGGTGVFYGAQKHDQYGYWDTTPEFTQRMNLLLELQRKAAIELFAPFAEMSKTDILVRGIELGVDYSLTWSCYNGREKACGTCPTCSERLRAFQNLNLTDPLEYET